MELISTCQPPLPRCTKHTEQKGDLHDPESTAALGGVSRHGGRGPRPLLQTNPTHPEHLQEHEL